MMELWVVWRAIDPHFVNDFEPAVTESAQNISVTASCRPSITCEDFRYVIFRCWANPNPYYQDQQGQKRAIAPKEGQSSLPFHERDLHSEHSVSMASYKPVLCRCCCAVRLLLACKTGSSLRLFRSNSYT